MERCGVNVVVIGAGGHAKAVCEAIRANGGIVVGYVDPRPAGWLDVARFDDDDEAVLPAGAAVVFGLGGVTPEALERRLALFETYRAGGREMPHAVHPAARVSDAADLQPGAIVLAGAVVQPGVSVGAGAIVNSGAIIEHDTDIGAGAHVAPGAVVLGGCTVGRCAMIGAGAVLLPGAEVADRATVPALTRYPK